MGDIHVDLRPPDIEWGKADAEQFGGLGLLRGAIGNQGGHRKEIDIGIRLIQRQIGEQGDEFVRRRHLVLGLDADVIDPRADRVRVIHQFVAATGKGLIGRGQRHRVKVRQSRERADIEVNIGPRRAVQLSSLIGGPDRLDGQARQGDVPRTSRHEKGVGVSGGVGDDIEGPLVGHAGADDAVSDGIRQQVSAEERTAGTSDLVVS